MTLKYLMIIIIVALLITCYDYMLSIVGLHYYSTMKSYSACSNVHWVSGEHSVGMVPRLYYFPAVACYVLGHVVDRGHR